MRLAVALILVACISVGGYYLYQDSKIRESLKRPTTREQPADFLESKAITRPILTETSPKETREDSHPQCRAAVTASIASNGETQSGPARGPEGKEAGLTELMFRCLSTRLPCMDV